MQNKMGSDWRFSVRLNPILPHSLYRSRVGAIEEATGGMIPTAEFERLSKIASQGHEKCIEARAHLFKQGC
jgi:hypothetical protein